MKSKRQFSPCATIPLKTESTTQDSTTPSVQPAVSVIVDSRDLFRQGTTLHIDHAGHRYVLRVTRENKLILTK